MGRIPGTCKKEDCGLQDWTISLGRLKNLFHDGTVQAHYYCYPFGLPVCVAGRVVPEVYPSGMAEAFWFQGCGYQE